jgi:ribonuclease J
VQKIKGLIITHAHDDHIGGIAYLLKTIPIPKIYAARLTLEIINRKLSEFDDLKAHEMAEINDDTVLTSKHFKIDFFRVCHSTPDAFGVCMQTVNGIICISGDFRFDFLTPGEQTDINKISQIAARKVDLLLCESTNAQTPGFGSSEKYVFEELDKTISQCKGRIFIAVFASNLYRIMQIVMAAVNNGRKVFVCGRSMNNNIEAATKAGYLKVPKGAIIDDLRDIGSYNPRDILVLITGGQGEENAALNKMATGSHQTLRFEPEDTVIFSSSPIPGNYESLQDLLNKLYHANVKLYISDSDKKIHSSGHATQTELQLFIRLFNPRYV